MMVALVTVIYALLIFVTQTTSGKVTSVAGKDTVCNVNEEYRRNSMGLPLDQKSYVSCHPKYGIVENYLQSDVYVSGCFFKDNHYADENNNCQPLSFCKSEKVIDFNATCGENEEYSMSKCNNCPLRCCFTSDGKHLSQMCRTMCLPPGCYCKNEYLLDENENCVQPTDCPPYPQNIAIERKWSPDNEPRIPTEAQNTTEF